MSLSYQSLQIGGVLGLLLLLFCSPIISLFAFLVVLTLIFIDCDITTKMVELFGEKPETLNKQVVWITGASYGIGEFLAYELARCGCKLILSARTESLLENVGSKCEKLGSPEIMVLPMDVTKTPELDGKLRKVIDRFGNIDVLINNAGRSIRGLFLETETEVERQLFELDYFAQIELTRRVVRSMVDTQTKGQIVMVTSVARNGVPFQSAYCGAKAALHGAFSAIRIECRSAGINVLFLVPGPVESRVSENAFSSRTGQSVGENKVIDKRMCAGRTARIMSIAIANRLSETWIAQRPYNLLIYAEQYLPTVSKLITIPMLEKRLTDYKKKFAKVE